LPIPTPGRGAGPIKQPFPPFSTCGSGCQRCVVVPCRSPTLFGAEVGGRSAAVAGMVAVEMVPWWHWWCSVGVRGGCHLPLLWGAEGSTGAALLSQPSPHCHAGEMWGQHHCPSWPRSLLIFLYGGKTRLPLEILIFLWFKETRNK